MADVNAVINELSIVIKKDEEEKSIISQCRFKLAQNAQQLTMLKNRVTEYRHSKSTEEINKFVKENLMECNEILRATAKEIWSISQNILADLGTLELETLNENYDKNVVKLENLKKIWESAFDGVKQELEDVQDSMKVFEEKRELEIQQQLVDSRNLQVDLNRTEIDVEKQQERGELIRADIKLFTEKIEEIANNIGTTEKEIQEMIDEKSLLEKNMEQLEIENGNSIKQILDDIQKIENEIKSVTVLMEGLSRTLTENEAFYKGLDAEYVKIKETNNGLHAEVNQRQESLDELQKYCAELSQFTEVQLQAKEDLINNQKMLLSSETLARDKILNDIETKRETLLSSDELINSLQAEITIITETTESVSKESMEMSEKNRAIQTEIDEILVKIEENKRQCALNEGEFTKLTLQKDSSASEIEARLKETLLQFENEIKLVQDEISEINETYNSTWQEIKECGQRKKQLESEIKEADDNYVKVLAEHRQNSLRRRQESEKVSVPVTPKRKSPPTQDDSESSVDERFQGWQRKMKKIYN